MPFLFLFPTGFEQDRGRERKVLSRGGRFETERCQRELLLLVCEPKAIRCKIPVGAASLRR